MGDFISALKENWTVIAGAPAAAIIWALLIGVALFFFFRATYANQIADLKSRLELRDDEIKDYQRKLGGASPDEAKARIDDLEKRIANLQPRERHLTAQQAAEIAAAVSGTFAEEGDFDLIYPTPSPEAGIYAHELAEAFQLGGWPVEADTMLSGHRVRHKGLTLSAPDLQNRAPVTTAVIEALTRAGIIFSLVQHSAAERTRLYVDMID